MNTSWYKTESSDCISRREEQFIIEIHNFLFSVEETKQEQHFVVFLSS